MKELLHVTTAMAAGGVLGVILVGQFPERFQPQARSLWFIVLCAIGFGFLRLSFIPITP